MPAKVERRPRQALTERQLVDIGKAYLAGVPVLEIAAKYDVHRTTITELRKKMGIAERKSERGVKAIANEKDIAAARKAFK